MRRRFLLLFLALLLPVVPATAWQGESRWSDVDTFVRDHADTAVYAADSETVDLYYLVADAHDLVRALEPEAAEDPAIRDMLYEVMILPKPGKTLRNLTVRLHFGEELQEIMFLNKWPMDEMPSPPGASGGGSMGWQTAIELEHVPKEGIPLEAFYRVLVELTWQGGGEVLYVDRNTPSFPPDAPEREHVHPLNEADVAYINQLAEALRSRK